MKLFQCNHLVFLLYFSYAIKSNITSLFYVFTNTYINYKINSIKAFISALKQFHI